MFERFTDEARRIVVLAQEEARQARAEQIGPHHVLLAIAQVDGPGRAVLQAAGVDGRGLRDAVHAVAGGPGEPLDPQALASLGIDLDAVRERVEATFGPGALNRSGSDRPRGHLRFADASKQALERALRAAFVRGDRSLDSRHVLIGILAVGDPRVTEVLRRLDVDPEQLRRTAAGEADAA